MTNDLLYDEVPFDLHAALIEAYFDYIAELFRNRFRHLQPISVEVDFGDKWGWTNDANNG
jgi:hypothetical protein